MVFVSPASRGACVALAVVLAALTGCEAVGYVAQAGAGQLDLYSRARPLDEVITDARVDARKRAMLAEVPPILAFAEKRGLDTKGNYRTFVQLDGAAAVWFTAAAPPLSLEPKKWSFPIVGSFTYLGWFDFVRAKRFRDRLRREGWDVYLRGASAYSTGGWFHDPVLSSMLPYRDESSAWYLADVLFHELTHANILINDQSTFNESLASFVGDTMADEYLSARYGTGSPERAAFHEDLEEDREIGRQLTEVYAELDALYKSNKSRAEKLRKKKEIVERISRELGLLSTPNNAMLAGFKTYNAGMPEFRKLLSHCGGSWPAFLRSIRQLDEASFPGEQLDDIGPVIATRLRTPCQ